MTLYDIYGLLFQSSLALHHLMPSHSKLAPDLVIYWPSDQDAPPEPDLNWRIVEIPESRQRRRIRIWEGRQANHFFLRVHYVVGQLGTIECVLCPAANQLWIKHLDQVSAENINSFLLGSILGCVLRRRGAVCLHASAVSIKGKGIVLLGAKRAGKSTTAAALMHYEDATFLSDDMAVLTQNNGGLTLQPGYPGLRLSPMALEQLYDCDIETLPLVYSNQNKRYLFISEGHHGQQAFKTRAQSVDAIYLLDERSTERTCVGIKQMSRSESIMQLMANTYASYAVFDKKMMAKEFAVISQLVNSVPIRRIQCLAGLDTLPKLCTAIVNDIA